jgi:methylglyoxal/glyoxal reductase
MSSPTPAFSIASRFRLNQAIDIPVLGLGVFQTPPGPATRQAVAWALAAGYRHIDTAAMYGNEPDVGEAVRASGIPREEVFVTTKLWHTEHGYDSALRAARASQERLGLGPIDLYLIHWPTAKSPDDRLASWKALEKLKKDGTIRAIGVSNYTVRHLEELAGHAEVVPAVDQVEFHPFVFDPELLTYCERHGIRLEAWSPLTRGRRLATPALVAIADRYSKSPAQVLLRWGLEHGIVELPKSTRQERIVENADVFDFRLTPAEMQQLDALRDGQRVGMWNPADIP